jgi:hypothetical protein
VEQSIGPEYESTQLSMPTLFLTKAPKIYHEEKTAFSTYVAVKSGDPSAQN